MCIKLSNKQKENKKVIFKNNIKSCNIEEVDNAFSTFEKDKLFTPKKIQ